MGRQFRIIRRGIKQLSGIYGYSFVFALCLSISNADAMPGASLSGAYTEHAAPLLKRVGVCSDGSYGCEDYPPAGHGGAYEAPPPGVYYKPAPPAAEPPCDEADYASHHPRAYLYTEGAPPPRQRYAAHPPDGRVPAPSGYHDYDDCGVRCWYQRLSRGYCGRGCDYYRYRLKEFPEGKFVEPRRRRLACRTGY